MMRFLATLIASAIAAQVAFYSILHFNRDYAYWHGAVIGAVTFSVIRLGEFAAGRRLPAWVAVLVPTLVAGGFYWFFTVAMVGI
jgi:hypothetical protein